MCCDKRYICTTLCTEHQARSTHNILYYNLISCNYNPFCVLGSRMMYQVFWRKPLGLSSVYQLSMPRSDLRSQQGCSSWSTNTRRCNGCPSQNIHNITLGICSSSSYIPLKLLLASVWTSSRSSHAYHHWLRHSLHLRYPIITLISFC